MKKLIALLLMMSLLLAGCKNEQKIQSPPETAYNTDGERVVLFCGEKEFPISFTVDGAQKIENGTYFYYELNKLFSKEWTESFYLYHQKDLELIDLKEYGTFEGRPYFATNGDWPLFLNPVHSEFSASNQERVDANLINAGRKILEQNNMGKEPLIITDAWHCNMDEDQEEEIFFKGCNYTMPYEKKKGAEVTLDELSLYSFLAYADGEDFQLLSGEFKRAMNENGDDQSEAVLSALTYDERGALVTSLLKRHQAYSFLKELRPIIADPDGDGKFSVFVYKRGDFEMLTLMDYKGGSFLKAYDILF